LLAGGLLGEGGLLDTFDEDLVNSGRFEADVLRDINEMSNVLKSFIILNHVVQDITEMSNGKPFIIRNHVVQGINEMSKGKPFIINE
jgi:hypothetical protein